MDSTTDLLFKYLADTNNLILVSCFIIGRICKGIPYIPDWTIPMIVGVFGIAQGIMFIGGDRGAVLGFIYAAVSVYGHQLIKQALQKDSSLNEEGSQNPPK